MDNNYYIQLLGKFLGGEINEEEKRELKRWIQEPESRAVCYAYYQQKWDEVSGEMDGEVQAAMLLDILSKIESSEPAAEEQDNLKVKPRIITNAFIRRFAAACLVITIGIGLYFFVMRAEVNKGNDVIVQVDNGQKAKITLSDGTVVYVNSGSRLTYDNTFNKKERIIELEGEAYFDVAKDKNKPFIVKASGLNIEALGTSFNVRSGENLRSVDVALIEGKVRLDNGDNELIMHPNELVKYKPGDKSFHAMKLHPNANHTLWRSNELAFYGETLEEICQVLTRMYDKRFVIDSEEIKNYTFTGVIRDNSLINVLDFITLSSSVKYEIRHDGIIEIKTK